jgi:Ca2+-binding RTX toxin-like protein
MGYRSLLVGIAMAAATAAPAQAATTYPSAANDFATGTQGWAGSAASCSPAGTSLCSTSNVYESGAGNPPGSISTRVTVTLNAAGVFSGSGTWTSPAFTVTPGRSVSAATFGYDRQLDSGSLATLGLESQVTVRLVDQTAGGQTTLLSETLAAANAAFSNRGIGVPPDAVVAGHTYRLQIQTVTRSTVVRVGTLGDANTRFDNVALAVVQGNDGAGTTPVVSDGVTFVKGLRTRSQIDSIWRRFSESAEVGHRAGGSLIPRKYCTIIGTPHADRIRGTRGSDVICGLGGKDVINGAGGVDLIDGGNGNDRIAGGAARDKLIGLRGSDRLNGGRGNDRVGGGAGRDRVSGASGNDRVRGGRGRDRILGGAGRDRIYARDRTRDLVNGGKGRDRAKLDAGARGARHTKAMLRHIDRRRHVEKLL